MGICRASGQGPPPPPGDELGIIFQVEWGDKAIQPLPPHSTPNPFHIPCNTEPTCGTYQGRKANNTGAKWINYA